MPGGGGPNLVNYNIAIGACARARWEKRAVCFHNGMYLCTYSLLRPFVFENGYLTEFNAYLL